jgi:hypothetical protein
MLSMSAPQLCAAQHGAAVPHPDTDYAEAVRPEPARLPATAFVMPDVPDDWNKATTASRALPPVEKSRRAHSPRCHK